MIWFTRFRNWNIPHNRLSDWKPLNLFIEYSLNRANMYHEIDLLSSNIFPWEGEQISQCICTPFGSIKYAAILLPLKAFLYWSDKVLHIAWAQCSCRKFSFMGKFQLLDLYEYIWMYNIEMIVMGVINVDWNVSDGDLPGNDKRFLRMLRSFRDFSVKKELFKKKKKGWSWWSDRIDYFWIYYHRFITSFSWLTFLFHYQTFLVWMNQGPAICWHEKPANRNYGFVVDWVWFHWEGRLDFGWIFNLSVDYFISVSRTHRRYWQEMNQSPILMISHVANSTNVVNRCLHSVSNCQQTFFSCPFSFFHSTFQVDLINHFSMSLFSC